METVRLFMGDFGTWPAPAWLDDVPRRKDGGWDRRYTMGRMAEAWEDWMREVDRGDWEFNGGLRERCQ